MRHSEKLHLCAGAQYFEELVLQRLFGETRLRAADPFSCGDCKGDWPTQILRPLTGILNGFRADGFTFGENIVFQRGTQVMLYYRPSCSTLPHLPKLYYTSIDLEMDISCSALICFSQQCFGIWFTRNASSWRTSTACLLSSVICGLIIQGWAIIAKKIKM